MLFESMTISRSNTYVMVPKDFVMGKNCKVIKLTRQHDQFTGTTKVEVRGRRKRMAKARRWTSRNKSIERPLWMS